jgi:hypothetical protein
MDWNECPESNGIGVRIAPEWVSGLPRNTQLKTSKNGFRKQGARKGIAGSTYKE